ncbi:MAG: hypothetical protein ACE5K1_10270 [Acidiferrobacterales bacterium]
MSLPKPTLILKTILTIVASLTFTSLAHAQSIGVGGGARASGGLGGPTARHGNLGSQSTVIRDGMGGFTMYNRDGSASRYLGKSQGNRVYHRDGSSSLVINDGKGGYTIYGPQGTHRVFPNPAPTADEMP